MLNTASSLGIIMEINSGFIWN